MTDRIDVISHVRPLESTNEAADWSVKPSKSFTRHDLFQDESFVATASISKFWNKATSHPTEKDEIEETDASLVVSAQQIETQPKPLSPIPVLDKPEAAIPPIQSAPSNPRNRSTALTVPQLEQTLSLMGDDTIADIIQIILHHEFELEKNTAETAEKTFEHYQKLKNMHVEMLQEVKDRLVKDQRVAGYLKTAQNITLAATCICEFAALANHFFGGFLGPMATTMSLAFTAGLTALTSGTSAYFKRRTEEDRAEQATFEHEGKALSDLSQEARQRLATIAENDHSFKDHLIRLIKRLRKMNSMMIKK